MNKLVHFNQWMQSCIRQYYLTASWDVSKSPLDLAMWFASAEVFLHDLVTSGSFVSPGKTVTLLDLELKEEITLTLVASDESDPEHAKISYFSPLGSQLLGCRAGDVVTVKIFSRSNRFQIINIMA